MKILYDISVLGLAQSNPLARTGVARVVEHILEELLLLEGIDLSLCTSFTQLYPEQAAQYSIGILRGALSYRANNLNLKSIDLCHSPILTALIQNTLENIKSLKIYEKTNSSHKNFLAQLAQVHQSLQQTLISFQNLPWLFDSTELNNFDIFHATFYPIPFQIRKSHKIVKFLTVYDLIPILYPQWFGNVENERNSETLNTLDSKKDWVICISQATKNDLCNYLPSLDPARVFVTHLAADFNKFYPCNNPEKLAKVKRKYKVPIGQYLLGLSTLEPRKNLPHLVRCFAQTVLQQNLQDLSLVLVGNPGWEFKALIDEITQYQSSLKNRIILTGRVEDEDLPALYSGAVAFVYPSLYEGFGLPPLEAMCCGTPVITSNTSSLPEVVDNAALMVAPDDKDALCQYIYDLCTNVELRQKLSAQGFVQAQNFSWKTAAKQTKSAYEFALSNC